MGVAVGDIVYKSYYTDINVKPIAADGERAVVATIRVGCDHEGDVLIPQGADTKVFKDNPIVYEEHAWKRGDGAKPVGHISDFEQSNEMFSFKVLFAKRPPDHPKEAVWNPDVLFSLYQQGVLRGFSPGFKIKASRRPNKLDLAKWPDAKRIIGSWQLLEMSTAGIPMNPDLLAECVSKGLVTEQQCKAIGIDTKSIHDAPRSNPPTRKYTLMIPVEVKAQPIDYEGLVSRAINKKRGALFV